MSTQHATSRGTYHPLLGTNVEVRVIARAATVPAAYALAEVAETVAVNRIVHLQSVFTTYEASSELCRWRAAEIDEVSPELTEVLRAAEHWWRVSGGAFHPVTERLRGRWLRAETDGVPPSAAELAHLVVQLAALPFTVTDAGVQRVGDCTGLDLNAIAKGYIVDQAAEAAAAQPGVVDVLVNAGGDLRHIGDQSLRVGVEDPRQPGGAPLQVVEVGEGALATSGPVHRGFRVGRHWYGHVLDPRTGRPVAGRPSTTVRAPDAMTADALATVAGVLDWPTAAAIVSASPAAGCLVVDESGEVLTCGAW